MNRTKSMACAICGQQHSRLADVIRSRFNAGESVESLAKDYGLPLIMVMADLTRLIAAAQAVLDNPAPARMVPELMREHNRALDELQAALKAIQEK